MAQRKVMCHGCKEKFDKEELIQVNKSKRLCLVCHDRTTKEAEDYKTLIKFICDGFGIKAPLGHQLKSIKDFKELGYSYQEIMYVLYYIFNIEGIKPQGTSLGLVPYYYEKAKEHYTMTQNARRTAIKTVMEPKQIVRKKKEDNRPLRGHTKFINISEIL